MRDRKGAVVTLPREVLADVCWSFVGTPFTDRRGFDAAVRQYQIDIVGEDTWQPQEIVIPCSRVRVTYFCWDGDDQIEPVIEFVSANGENFTAGELLFKIHNTVVEQLREIDHHFFEGLELHPTQTAGMPPLYELQQGS